MNELTCYGVRITFPTRQDNLNDAVKELEMFMSTFNIDVELCGMMQLYDEADRLMEEC